MYTDQVLEKDHCLLFCFDEADRLALQDEEDLLTLLRSSLQGAGIDVFNSVSHKFCGGGEGVTAVCIIGASCADIHTWPENNTLVLQCFACGDKEKEVGVFILSMIEHLLPTRVYSIPERSFYTAIPRIIPLTWQQIYERPHY